MVLLRHPCAGAIPSPKARLPLPTLFLVLHHQGTLTLILRRVSPDSPRPFPLQKRKEKSGWKSEAGKGGFEGDVESDWDSTKWYTRGVWQTGSLIYLTGKSIPGFFRKPQKYNHLQAILASFKACRRITPTYPVGDTQNTHLTTSQAMSGSLECLSKTRR